MPNGITKRCELLERYTSGHLTKYQLQAFEVHARSCPDCKLEMDTWDLLYRELAESFSDQAEKARPSLYEARALATRAREQDLSSTGWNRRLAWSLAGGLALALSIVTYLAFSPGDTSGDPDRTNPQNEEWIAVALYDGARQEGVPKWMRARTPIHVDEGSTALVTLGRDRVGVDSASEIQITSLARHDVALTLNSGTIACSVEPRKGSGRFHVRAGDHKIEVVGTVFTAQLSSQGALKVAVERGVVEVQTSDGPIQHVEAGAKLEVLANGDGRLGPMDLMSELAMSRLLRVESVHNAGLDSPPLMVPDTPTGISSDQRHRHEGSSEDPTATTSFRPKDKGTSQKTDSKANVDTWKQWILQGRGDEAEQALGNHLSDHPDDFRAWAVLAHARRKSGDMKGALDAYLSAANNGSAISANQYRFRAGVLLQDRLKDQNMAATTFEAFLAQPGGESLRVVAMSRLVKAYLATGKKDAAERMLTDIIKQHEGTMPAVEARKMLDDMEGK